MSRWMVNKTGMDLFDASRAYGLSLLISRLLAISEQPADVKIRDAATTYLVETRFKLPKDIDINTETWRELFVINENTLTQWRTVFRTIIGKKREPEELAKDVEKTLSSNVSKILDRYSKQDYAPLITQSKLAGTETLLQSLDLVAAKGVRIVKRGLVFGEGDQLRVDSLDAKLAYLGAVHFFRNFRTNVGLVTLLPNPTDIDAIDHLRVEKDFDASHICRLSTTATIAHYAIRLERMIVAKVLYDLRYGLILFNTMIQTGQQPKPGGGGRFTTTFIEEIARKPESEGLLSLLDDILTRGPDAVRLTLADFLADPSFLNYKPYLAMHMRKLLTGREYEKDILSGYTSELLSEVLKVVKS